MLVDAFRRILFLPAMLEPSRYPRGDIQAAPGTSTGNNCLLTPRTALWYYGAMPGEPDKLLLLTHTAPAGCGRKSMEFLSVES